MNLPDLPALPEAYTRMPKTIPAGAGVALLSVVDVFTADQLRAFALAYGALVREECAKKCEGLRGMGGGRGWNQAAEYIAAAIRSEE